MGYLAIAVAVSSFFFSL